MAEANEVDVLAVAIRRGQVAGIAGGDREAVVDLGRQKTEKIVLDASKRCFTHPPFHFNHFFVCYSCMNRFSESINVSVSIFTYL